MTGRGDEVDAEALAVVHRAREPGDLELAAVARAGVHLADREGAAEQPARPRIHLAHQMDGLVVARRQRLGGEPDPQDLGEEPHVSGAGARGAARGACLACR